MTTRDEYPQKLKSRPRSPQGRPEHRNVHYANFG